MELISGHGFFGKAAVDIPISSASEERARLRNELYRRIVKIEESRRSLSGGGLSREKQK